jgi:hypothetical protein
MEQLASQGSAQCSIGEWSVLDCLGSYDRWVRLRLATPALSLGQLRAFIMLDCSLEIVVRQGLASQLLVCNTDLTYET